MIKKDDWSKSKIILSMLIIYILLFTFNFTVSSFCRRGIHGCERCSLAESVAQQCYVLLQFGRVLEYAERGGVQGTVFAAFCQRRA